MVIKLFPKGIFPGFGKLLCALLLPSPRLRQQHCGYGVFQIVDNDLFIIMMQPRAPDPINEIRIPVHDTKEGGAKVLTAQGLGVQRLCGVWMPSDTVHRIFFAWPYRYFLLRGMQEKLNVPHIREFSHTEQIKCNSILGYCHCRTFITGLCKLVPDNLIPFEIKRRESAFGNLRFSDPPSHTVGRVIVQPGIIVDPMVIDGDEAAKDPIIYHMKTGKGAADMMLSVLQECLHQFKFLPWDDRFMLPFIMILIHVLPVSFTFVFKQI